MPRYHRILVRFRLPLPSQEWSDLHWCEIEKTDEDIKISVAPINQTGMPTDEKFKTLDPEQAKKLLVIDFPAAQKPRQPGAPFLARREEEISKYCVVLYNHSIYKFNFDMHTHLLMKVGQIWKVDREFDNSKETINTIFKIDEIARDSRLQLRTAEPYNYNLLNSEATVIESKHQQLRDWQQRLIREQEAAQQRQLAIHAKQQAEQEQWQSSRCTPVVVEISRLQNSMDDLDQVKLHACICESLTDIKRNSDNPALYGAVLYQLMTQANTPEEYSPELKAAIQRFREDFLINSGTLNLLFADEESTHPSFSTVYNYVLDVVFIELQVFDPSFVGASAYTYKKPCPQSDANLCLGIPRVDILAEPVNEADDAGLAAALQEEIYGARNRHAAHRLFRPPQLRNNLALILGAALATYAIYLAVTSSVSWLALGVFIGVAVVAATTLRNRAPEGGNAPRFRF